MREAPAAATRLLVDHVRHRGGDDAVVALLESAGLDLDLDLTSSGDAHTAKIALFEAASTILEDPDLGRHAGESLLELGDPGLLPVLQALGSPAGVLRALVSASSAYAPNAAVEVVEVRETDAVVRYRVETPHAPNRHDCGYTRGVLSRVAPVFGLPAAEVEHPACQVDGADACVYHVRWSAVPRKNRLIGRRARRDQLKALSARFWELEGDTLDLIGPDDDPWAALEAIADRAAEAVGASGHVLVLTRADVTEPVVVHDGFVGGSSSLVDEVLHGLTDDDDPFRIVAEVASDHHRYGYLIATFDDATELLAESRTILKAYARRAAVALDAAATINDARIREETASVLLQLARSLSELTTVADISQRLSELVPMVTGAQQAGVMLYDHASRCLRMGASWGVPAHLQAEIDTLVVPVDAASVDLPSDGERPTVIPRAEAVGFFADIMDRHDESLLALVPMRVRGRLRGMITAGWRDDWAVGPRDVLEERLRGIAAQAATALENATLLEQVRHQALHDALTGLPNQSLFADHVATEIARAKRNRARVAVAVLDLDRFKTVNDSLGHGAGDALLVEVAKRLRSAMRAPDTVARMGGDEFTLLLPDMHDGGERRVAERVLEAFAQPFELDGHRIRISPSVGLSVYPDDGDSFDQLLRCADIAMYRAKERGRNTWACYATGMADPGFDRLTLENDLDRALQRKELRVAYQPIAHVTGAQLVGSEALVRWSHPELGLLTPQDFLPIAADMGMAAEIDGWVLRQACLELGAATAAGARPGSVAVNLSSRTLLHPALERLVADALAAGGLDPNRLVVEVHDELTGDSGALLADRLAALRAIGVRVALDDFGRGPSSLGRLEHLPIDQLKVDSVFLNGIESLTAPAPVLQAVVTLGRGLGFELVAEGVETKVQRAFAEQVGFDLVQGWYVGRPVSSLYDGARSRTA